jgi:hypothetical protein
MRIDTLVLHAEDIGSIVGELHGTPIREVDMLVVDIRAELEAQRAARHSLGNLGNVIELLPGEVVKDGLIRRETTAEVVGEKFYEHKP